MRKSGKEGRTVAVVAGAIAGAVLGAIVAVNIMIFGGTDDGYEASLGEVFDHNVFIGGLVVAALVAGPVVGIVGALWLRARQNDR